MWRRGLLRTRMARSSEKAKALMVEANRQRQRLRLSQTKQALEALANGEYGYCRRCEEPISHARLVAKPESPICLACQSAMEARR